MLSFVTNVNYCFISALLASIFTADIVYSQVTVEGFIGGSVLLPCVSKKHEHNLHDINVLWRHNASMNVFTIINGRGSVEHQDPKYKNKTKKFPDEFVKGNFSLKLYNLEYSDAGEYVCYITHSSEVVAVQLRINVYSQVTVEGLIGGSVLLPCVSKEHEHDLNDINVLWRCNDSMNLYAIGRDSVEHQEAKYKNRCEVFPDEFVKGNFSLKLKSLTHNDAGKYECCMTHSSEFVKVQLVINENQETAEKGNESGTPKLLMAILIPLLFIAVLIIFYFVYRRCIRAAKTSSSRESNATSEELNPVNQNHHD